MIDAVILWVDPSDEKWLEDYCKYTGKDKASILDSNRFKDWNTLLYLFRSIDFCLPWINKVHFITCGHLPHWLNKEHEKIIFHSHKDIFENHSDLPTFNSSAIEINIVNIPELAEKFIYFNDDFLVLKKTNEDRFFIENKPVDFLRLDWPKDNPIIKYKHRRSEWQSMILNNLRLINEEFDIKDISIPLKDLKGRELFKQKILSMMPKITGFEHYHHVQPYLKSSLQKINTIFRQEYLDTSASRFRKHENISQALYRYYQLCSGDYYDKDFKDHKVFKLTTHDYIKSIDLKSCNIVCLNDNYSDSCFDESKRVLAQKLEEIFPKKSSFEL
ncbi:MULTISPECIES: Stealth CR1 domain-containing protein [Vibrio]|uniref:Stealth CR1 domain-containing protein n=1 Tax=Vibrio TaxID=662 RepID=UPI00148251FF|nr:MULTISPECIES: Stealth CR1 domain-containing protein [Vibrio]EJA7360947.1 stealth family protein [Vibrio alginolyticus]MCA2450190.1 stealth family protein [Vibrio alginolyticus]MCA2473680.1 stealth family protein [Vibrio alginolyticus]MDW1797009.1 Stealth CR1 domain-containing protein [Vibrio sp. Vb2297]MDW2153707.1 Stealth CR1 domain-containing protein [Vibrio sp. 2092]